ncbi:helix-turn-helix transcriptional regulator [Serratia fonticola]|uniref:helix-turn-helix domain-containing protein n=1 Tax=Serratia fonticola TaxID=47917 RepID=UPI003AADFF0D
MQSDDNNSNKVVGERIKQRRAVLGLSQLQVAKKLGVSMQAVSLWEQGKTSLSSAKLSALAEVLECNIYWLLEGQGDPLDVIEKKEHIHDKYISDMQESPLREFISDEERKNLGLTEDLYHLAQLFGDLDEQRRGNVLRYAIEQRKEHIKEELMKYEELYKKYQ